MSQKIKLFLASLLVSVLTLTSFQASSLYAMEDDNNASDDNTVEEQSDTESEIKVVEDATDAEDDEDIEKAAEDVLNNLDGRDPEAARRAIKAIQDGIKRKTQQLEDESRRAPGRAKNFDRQIDNLESVWRKIKAKALTEDKDILPKKDKKRDDRGLYEIRWGAIGDRRASCKGVADRQLEDSLEEGEIPKECLLDEEKIEYKGSIEVNTGTLKVHREVLFEKNDVVNEKEGQMISFNSNINGHWDGLIVSFEPEKKESSADADGAEREPLKVTINLGDLSQSFAKDDLFGRKDIGNNHMLEIKPLIKVLDGVSEKGQEEIMEQKVKIKEKIEKVQNKVQQLQLLDRVGRTDDLSDVLEEIEEYNFDEITTDEVNAEMDLLVADLDDSDDEGVKQRAQKLRKKIASLKEKAKTRKYQKNLIPFKDTDDEDWYTEFVYKAKNRGIFSGYKDKEGNELGEFRPSNNITIAEIMKVGLETAGKGESNNGQKPKLKEAASHWARGYVKRAEELNLDIAEDEDTDINRPATRGEVVRMMLEALGLKPETSSGTDFSDVPADHPHAKFIQYAKKLGIISGDSGKTTFRPDEPINRAEASKITNQVIENLLEEEVVQ